MRFSAKPFDSEELLARLRAAFRHRNADGARSGNRFVPTMSRSISSIAGFCARGRKAHLLPKEYEVLAELAKKPDRVITHAQLLRTHMGAAHLDRVEYLRPRLLRNEPGVGYRLTVH